MHLLVLRVAEADDAKAEYRTLDCQSVNMKRDKNLVSVIEKKNHIGILETMTISPSLRKVHIN